MPCGNEDRDWHEVAAGGGMPAKITGKPSQVRKKQIRTPLQVSEGARNCQHLDFKIILCVTIDLCIKPPS